MLFSLFQRSVKPCVESTEDRGSDTTSTDQFAFDNDWFDAPDLTVVDRNVTCYLAGYICYKLKHELHNCDVCLAAYVAGHTATTTICGEDYIFTSIKSYDWAQRGLTMPTANFLALCKGMEKVVASQVESAIGRDGVAVTLERGIRSSLDCDSYFVDNMCDEHHSSVLDKVVRLFIRIRIYHFVKIRNREIKELADKRKNRKANKVMGK